MRVETHEDRLETTRYLVHLAEQKKGRVVWDRAGRTRLMAAGDADACATSECRTAPPTPAAVTYLHKILETTSSIRGAMD